LTSSFLSKNMKIKIYGTIIYLLFCIDVTCGYICRLCLLTFIILILVYSLKPKHVAEYLIKDIPIVVFVGYYKFFLINRKERHC
jgi:hypothetical protein